MVLPSDPSSRGKTLVEKLRRAKAQQQAAQSSQAHPNPVQAAGQPSTANLQSEQRHRILEEVKRRNLHLKSTVESSIASLEHNVDGFESGLTADGLTEASTKKRTRRGQRGRKPAVVVEPQSNPSRQRDTYEVLLLF